MSDDMTADEIVGLKIAHNLVDAGIPVFAAPQCPPGCPLPVDWRHPEGPKHKGGPGEYHLPRHWQQIHPSHAQVDRWKPGWALAAIGGHAADFLDIDPRSGGLESEKELRHPAIAQFPRSFGQQETPSGGSHHLISATGERKCTGFMPGLDLQSGGPIDHNGTAGRGFVWIAPTVRASKAADTLGELRAYRWVHEPDLEALADFVGCDDTIEGIVARVHAKRPKPTDESVSRSALALTSDAFSPFATMSQVGQEGRTRAFTLIEAQDFVRPFLISLQDAPIGEIEERCNAAAAVLSHFVPSHWGVDAGMRLLENALSRTAYDPAGPSAWTVDKFRSVLDGSRPIVGDAWTATVREEAPTPEAVRNAVENVDGDEVTALIAEMLTLSEIKTRPAPQYLIKGLLNLDSEAWVIGAPGSKKSFVVLDMGLHVARGQEWQGLKVTQADVIILAAEGAGGLSNRVRAYEMQHGPLPDNVHILPRPVQAGDVRKWAVLVAACERVLSGRPGMIVLDTQARITVGLKENDATDMGFYVAAVGALRRATGACVLTVHHTGRADKDARGSNAIDGAQDTELKVVKVDKLTGELRVEKQKDLDELEPMPLTFVRHVVGTDEDGEPVTSLALSSDPYEDEDGKGPDAPPWLSSIHEKDVWRNRILEVLYVHAAYPDGWTKAELEGFMAAHYTDYRKTSGSVKTAMKSLLEAYDHSGEKVIGGSTPARMGILSEQVRSELSLKFGLDGSSPE